VYPKEFEPLAFEDLRCCWLCLQGMLQSHFLFPDRLQPLTKPAQMGHPQGTVIFPLPSSIVPSPVGKERVKVLQFIRTFILCLASKRGRTA